MSDIKNAVWESRLVQNFIYYLLRIHLFMLETFDKLSYENQYRLAIVSLIFFSLYGMNLVLKIICNAILE
jgi:hypothetical protein